MELSMWDEDVPISVKEWANAVAQEAVRRGILTRPESCSACGEPSKRIHGHHPDYMKPLDVRWLCPRCHKSAHGFQHRPDQAVIMERLKTALEVRGYTYVGKYLGVSGNTVRTWLSGRCRFSIEELEAIESLRPESEQMERDEMALWLKKWRRLKRAR